MDPLTSIDDFERWTKRWEEKMGIVGKPVDMVFIWGQKKETTSGSSGSYDHICQGKCYFWDDFWKKTVILEG